jgi:hypothetical protein
MYPRDAQAFQFNNHKSQGASPRRIYIGSCAGTHFAYRSLSVSSLGAKLSVAYFTHLLGLAASAFISSTTALVYALSRRLAGPSVPLLLMETHASPLPSGLGHLCHRFPLSAYPDLRVNASKGERNSGCPTYSLVLRSWC